MSSSVIAPVSSRAARLAALSAAFAAVAVLAPSTAVAAVSAPVACDPWSATVKYTKGTLVSESGHGYKAATKNTGQDPATHNGPKGSGEPWIPSTKCETTPPPPPPSGHWLVGYWHDFTNPSGPTFPISKVTDDWDVIIVAFADNAGNGNISFTLDPNAGSEAQFIADIAAKHKAGKKVVLSVGGQNGSISLDNSTMVANFVNSAYALIQKYGFDGIDLDLETGVSQGTALQANIVTAMKQLKAKVGPTFYLSMAPEHPYVQGGYVAYGSIWGAYLPIIDGLRNDLSVIHVQYYNNGGFTYDNASNQMVQEGTVDGLVAGSLMLIEGFTTAYNTGWHFNGLRPDQVAFGVPSGPSSANTGFVTSSVISNTLNCLTRLTGCNTIKPAKAYPTFRGAMTWSINWDKHDGYNFSVPTRAALNALP